MGHGGCCQTEDCVFETTDAGGQSEECLGSTLHIFIINILVVHGRKKKKGVHGTRIIVVHDHIHTLLRINNLQWPCEEGRRVEIVEAPRANLDIISRTEFSRIKGVQCQVRGKWIDRNECVMGGGGDGYNSFISTSPRAMDG